MNPIDGVVACYESPEARAALGRFRLAAGRHRGPVEALIAELGGRWSSALSALLDQATLAEEVDA